MKKLIKIVDWPILFGIGQFLITIVFSFIFLLMEQKSNSNMNYDEIINAENFANNLSVFLSNQSIWIIILMVIIFLPVLLKKYKIYINSNDEFNIKNGFLVAVLGSSLALIVNIIIFRLNISNRYDNFDNSNLFINILSSGILGPILEELIFRGIVYNRLKQVTNIKKAMFFSSLIFALFHVDFSQICYAFFMGYLFVNIYEKYSSLKLSMIAHMSANIVITLFIAKIVSINVINQLIIYMILSILFVFLLKNCNLFQKKVKI